MSVKLRDRREEWAALHLTKELLTVRLSTDLYLAIFLSYHKSWDQRQHRNFIQSLECQVWSPSKSQAIGGQLVVVYLCSKILGHFELPTLLSLGYLECFYGKMDWTPEESLETFSRTQDVVWEPRAWTKAAVFVFPRVCSCHNSRLMALRQSTQVSQSNDYNPCNASLRFEHFLRTFILVTWELSGGKNFLNLFLSSYSQCQSSTEMATQEY